MSGGRSLLVIDRGSREPEARDELGAICAGAMRRGGYDHASYCFLEVEPPYIPEGIEGALAGAPGTLTIVPYFLYPGRKSKAAVTDAMRLQAGAPGTRFVVSRAMSMHPTMVDIVRSRVSAALEGGGEGATPPGEVDVLVVCHGSKDPNAKRSVRYVVDALSAEYRGVDHCFLEIEKPDIRDGVRAAERRRPRVLVVVFYFLHEGAHVKRDIYEDLNPALEEAAGLGKVLVTRHIGADERMIDLVVGRAREAEAAAAA